MIHLNLTAQNTILNKKLSLNYSNISIDDALDSIAKKSSCYFTYNSDLFKSRNHINLVTKNQELNDILRIIIPDSTLNFHADGPHIVIVPVKYDSAKNISQTIIPYISYRNISGKIAALPNKKALPYASVGIRGKHIGTISNQDGEFSLTISSDHITDTLVFSYVGYKNTEIPISKITNEPIQISLKEDFISLQEVIIRNNDPLALLHAAVNKISENYPQRPTNLTSFYRESVLKNSRYMIYLESVLDIYKTSYSNKNLKDRVKLFKSRKIYDVTRLDTISFKLKGGIQACMQLDIAKNLPEFLDPEFMKFFHYRLADISTFNNNSVYIIEFEPKPNLETPMFKGKIFIETNNLAIIRAEFGYERNRLSELRNQFIVKGNAKTKVKPLIVNYVIGYRKINEKYYFNHALGNLKFKVKNKKKFFSNNFSTSFEMATTNMREQNVVKFKYRETIHPSTIFSNHKSTYDPNFWGDKNYIQPEENIKDALKRISNSMQQIALGELEEK
ncbi:carboxypeptidase-like regulatory domain-containing protein [Marinifilum sp. RC60d5]|uniref:carboxypeptidase-like regulatory domain-containing protein n=1 Tax=Marinifilum sp. RC60d5 TaxID=3458414 RepID=UPI0040372A50